MPPIARVLPLTTARALRGPFDYLLDGLPGDVGVGSLLRIPFAGRSVLGIVVSLADMTEVAPERLAVPHEVLAPGLTAELVELALWLAAEYCSTPARALSLMLPPSGTRERRRLVATLSGGAGAGGGRLTPGQRTILERLKQGPLPASALGLTALRRLERRGLVVISDEASPRRPVHVSVGARHDGVKLSEGQRRALAAIGRQGSYLLHGVTGSGKTEVYLRAAESTLGDGRGVIVLVPEIALTPQTVARFVARFGETVAVLHSGLSAGERHDEWLRLRRGEARICVGPRSAVFAPISDLGLLVVDEEHDSSYKHEGDPRYDARSVAARRAAQSGAVLLCGSATPRPESVHSLRVLRLEQRIDGRPLPGVEVLDMRAQHHPLHPVTRIALGDVRRAGGKAIVLVNRRGWSNFLACRACGQIWGCPNCEVALVLHRADGLVACHHCGHREQVPSRCTKCGSPAVARHGAGTERLERELAEALGTEEFPVFRLDADIRRDRVAAVLSRFEASTSGVLVGTQMVAKGHDFPEVSLGVVLDADQTLRFPDFRAEERTFSLITQLAGRAGRGGSARVLVQTLAPEARSIVHASGHDSDGFLAEELEHRRALSYPPFGTLIRIICASADPEPLDRLADELRAAIGSDAGTVLGPASLFRLRGRERRQLLIKTQQRAAAIRAVDGAVQGAAAAASRLGVSISVDVDPQ
jgi:primosomal protein N' (replication factor Y)